MARDDALWIFLFAFAETGCHEGEFASIGGFEQVPEVVKIVVLFVPQRL